LSRGEPGGAIAPTKRSGRLKMVTAGRHFPSRVRRHLDERQLSTSKIALVATGLCSPSILIVKDAAAGWLRGQKASRRHFSPLASDFGDRMRSGEQ
jgi:hypothetical protein